MRSIRRDWNDSNAIHFIHLHARYNPRGTRLISPQAILAICVTIFSKKKTLEPDIREWDFETASILAPTVRSKPIV